jgi:hypothetical protein
MTLSHCAVISDHGTGLGVKEFSAAWPALLAKDIEQRIKCG